MKNFNQVILFTFTCFLGSFGFSQTRYVATSGSDVTNACTNSTSPCKTVEHALFAANSGDSILINGGNYALDGTLNIAKNNIVITATNPTDKPVFTSNAENVINVNATNITLSNLVFDMGLENTNGKIGIYGTSNFDGLKLTSNEFYSTNPGGSLSSGMIFGSYAILLETPSSSLASISITNNIVSIKDSTNDVFGRGIGLGNQNGDRGPGGLVENNDIAAYYAIQGILISDMLSISNNNLKGQTMIGYTTNGATVTLDNNTFDVFKDQYAAYALSLLDIRATNTGNVIVSNNIFQNYLYMGLFSMDSRNVTITKNTFSPSENANQFVSIQANTKLQTSGHQSDTYSNEIEIQGNTFNSGMAGKGTAILFADHYGATTPAFDSIIVGGAASDLKNNFDTNLGNYIVLDSLSGSSDQVNIWNATSGSPTPATIMKPFSQSVYALASDNNYGLTDTSAIEAKNIDSLDVSGLGKVILGYVSPAGVQKNILSTTKIYPNPANNTLQINLVGTNEAHLSILDVLGNVVYVTNINKFATIDISSLDSGLYFVKLSEGNQSYSQKLIKK